MDPPGKATMSGDDRARQASFPKAYNRPAAALARSSRNRGSEKGRRVHGIAHA